MILTIYFKWIKFTHDKSANVSQNILIITFLNILDILIPFIA